MKPIQLKMQAFASYGVETCIDFRNLNQKLFLITGDTGSGKTTIFDAIVFALYGEASSSINKKEGIVLQSQYAPLNVEPYVELTFTEGNDEQCYTVRRVPKHLRLLTRGAGKGIDTREVNGSVTLTMPDGTDYPSKEAGKKIVDLIGLTKEQFMQIAMIAQGEFLQLLRAKSDDKKVIFRKLFHTELYEQIVREVDNRKKNLEKTLATVRTECQTELGHVRIPTQSEHAGQLNMYLEQLQNGALVQMAPFLEELEALLQERKQEQKSAAARLKQAEKERDCIRDAETEAEGLQRAYEQLDAAERYLRQAEAERADYEEKERLVSKIRAAYAIDTEYRHLRKSSDLLARTQKDLKMHQTNLPIQKKQAELCRVEEQAQQEHYNHVLEQTSKIEAQVTAALDIFAKQELAAAEMKTAAQTVATLQDSQQKTEESFTALTAFQEQYTNELAQYDTLSAEQERSHLEEKELDAFAEQLTVLHRQADQLTLQKKRSADALTAYEAARRTYQGHKEHYEQLRQQFLDTQAGFLARDLAPGAPCPVCGSTEHPRLRILTESHPELTKEALDSAEAQATLLAEVQEKKSANSQAENAKFRQMEQRLQEDWESFCEKLKAQKNPCTPAALTDADDWLKKQQSAWCAQRDFLQEQVRKQTACKNALDTTITKLRELEPIRTELQKKLQNANQQFTEKQTTYRTLDTSSAFSDRQAALAASKEAKAESEQAKALYEEKKAASAATSRTAEQTEALLRRCESELPGYEKAVQEQAAAYETLLAEHHVTEADWQALTEQYPSAEADRLQRLCIEWRNQLTAAIAKREAAAALIGKQERPDLSLLKEQYLEAEQRVRTARDESDTIRMELQDNETVLRHLQPKLDAREQTVAEHARLERLYRQVSGNVKGSRMDLETYVQRYFLRRILYAANLRFQEMSGGQFELRMVEEAEAGDGKNRGLDLMVYSAVTGKVREIRTLSGGESFLAALSLALGMADQIKESAPGIHLDVMFLDEGFGSLDESARDQAVRVLQEMAGASRLIGIISHVTELKQEIDDQLLVTKDEHGSHVRWQIS